jgi:C4-dicarboxylate-specific signal transduction histidine kinase
MTKTTCSELRKGELQLQPLDVNELVRNALKLVRSDLVNQKVALYTELAPHLPAINGDGVQLHQVAAQRVAIRQALATIDGLNGQRAIFLIALSVGCCGHAV